MEHLPRSCSDTSLAVCGHGIDVSKLAVRLAAGRHGHSAVFAVASSYRLPFEDEASMDLRLNHGCTKTNAMA